MTSLAFCRRLYKAHQFPHSFLVGLEQPDHTVMRLPTVQLTPARSSWWTPNCWRRLLWCFGSLGTSTWGEGLALLWTGVPRLQGFGVTLREAAQCDVSHGALSGRLWLPFWPEALWPTPPNVH